MNQKEVKAEIQKVIDNAPAEILEDILEYLKLTLTFPESNVRDLNHLRQILREDKELLEKLAQ